MNVIKLERMIILVWQVLDNLITGKICLLKVCPS